MLDEKDRNSLVSPKATEKQDISESFTVETLDGYVIKGRYWRHAASSRQPRAVVVINPATSVCSRYYKRFAEYLFSCDLDVITYDYRGIGESRPENLRGFRASWLDWGHLDFDAVLRFAEKSFAGQPIHVVAHSVGGFVIGLAPSNHLIHRIFTVGAQYAHWKDYARGHRIKMLLKWHVVMPLLTALFGYFPGKRLGWLEDTPKGVVRDWGHSRRKIEETCQRGFLAIERKDRQALVEQFAAVTAPTLAVGLSDDEFGTVEAIERLLAYFKNSPRTHLRLSPAAFGVQSIGHFAFFHSRFEQLLWHIPVKWLRTGKLPDDLSGNVIKSGQ